MADTNTLEMMFELWHNGDGYHYEIGPDRDGLDLIEIRYYDSPKDEKCHSRMTFTYEQAALVADALQKLVAAGCPR